MFQPYVSDDGMIRDGVIENLFDDFFYGRVDEISFGNLNGVARAFNPSAYVEITPEVLSNANALLGWCIQFAPIRIWRLSSDERTSLAPAAGEDDMQFAAILERSDGEEESDYVCGKTPAFAAVLAVIQSFREVDQVVENHGCDSLLN